MDDIKSKLEKKFEEIFGHVPGDDYEPRIKNARVAICQERYKRDDIIEIFDTSIGSNGKSGLVLTVDSVCVKYAGNSTSKFIAKYSKIDHTYMNKQKFLGLDISALQLHMKNGSKYEISIDAINKNKLKEFIDYAIELYVGQ